MKNFKNHPAIFALVAALLFGASAPLTKIMLGEIDPVPLAAFLYLGSGIGLFLFETIRKAFSKSADKEAGLIKKDIPWLLGAIIFGGIVAPIVLMISLDKTPASTASLLLNFEGVATMLIAMIFFKESLGKQAIGAVLMITIASIMLSWDASNKWGISIYALGIILACVSWGIDNNFTRNISAKNPFSIVIVKGIAAGTFSILLTLVLGINVPDIIVALKVMIIGFFCYGMSIVLFVYALRSLGSARSSALFGTSPFIGALLSFLLIGDTLKSSFILAFPIMVIGTVLLLKENHAHTHKHEATEHEHSHRHDDGHHSHTHNETVKGRHSHAHKHQELVHEHVHLPDTEHRHAH